MKNRRAETDRTLRTERDDTDPALRGRHTAEQAADKEVDRVREASETDEGRRTVVAGKRIQLYAARMNRLIGDLVDVVSIDAGKLACAIVPSDPLALIAETLETFRRAAEDKGIVLESEVTGALPRAAFDYERMLQVFANLVSNALKFTPRGGTICIRGERTGNQMHLSVSDTGLGMSENMFDAVFLRFWQAATPDAQGTGLGIWIESNIGQGSVFHFTVPVAASA